VAADDYVKAVIELYVPIGPQPTLDLFTRNQLAGPLEQQTEQIDGLSADPHRLPASPQPPSAIVKLEVSEAVGARSQDWTRAATHGARPRFHDR